MKPFNGVELFKFLETFPNEDQCKEYVYDLKFTPDYACSKCNKIGFYKGIKPYTKVCKNCRHVESATSNTMYDKVKFGLRKALYIQYDMTTTSAGISAKQISKKYDIQYNTAWLFMKKVRDSMQSSEQYPMVDKVSVDEFVIGGYEKGAVGRSAESKKIKASIAVEVTPSNKIKRVYAMPFTSYHTEEIRKIFDKHISKDSKIYTDKSTSYLPLRKEYNIKMDKKYKKNSPANFQIQQIKSWIRHIHKHVSADHIQTYFNEYSFRINRSQSKDSIFHKSVERMVKAKKKTKILLSAKKKCMTRDELVERIKLYRAMNANFKITGGRVLLVA